MIPMANILEWRAAHPWQTLSQVEQDLLLSRCMVDLFSHADLAQSLAMRGGTVLHKMHFVPAQRYTGNQHATCGSATTQWISSTCLFLKNWDCLPMLSIPFCSCVRPMVHIVWSSIHLHRRRDGVRPRKSREHSWR